MREQGVVLHYFVNRGYGFIKTSTGQSLFVHIRQVRGSFLLEAGDTVTFIVGPSTKQQGQNECFDVEVVERAAKAAL